MRIIEPSFKIIDEYKDNILLQIERCGRVCYKSEDKITPGSAEKFIKNIIKNGHESVLEMANITLHLNYDTETTLSKFLETVPRFFQISKLERGEVLITGSPRSFRDLARAWPTLKITKAIMLYLTQKYPILFEDLRPKNGWVPQDGISINFIPQDELEKLPLELFVKHKSLLVHIITNRAVTHELVRHRIASYLQESQRYCRYSDDKFGNTVTFIKPLFFDEGSPEFELWKEAMEKCEEIYMKLLETSSPQAARTVLPNSCKTEIIVNAYLDEWMHILKLRTSRQADPSMRQIMLMILDEFCQRYPQVFGLIKETAKI